MVPMKTYREGDKITKIVVEDVYKIINRIYEKMDKAYNQSSDILESYFQDYVTEDEEGKLCKYTGNFVIGTGISEPCCGDEFDEEIGNEIAFRKAKLNANIKKLRLIEKIIDKHINFVRLLYKEVDKLESKINKDLEKLNKYN